MSKLTANQKQHRKTLKAKVKALGGVIYSSPIDLVTVVVCPTIQGDNCKHAKVSVAHCSPHETFKRKFGELMALERMFYNGVSITVCLNGRTIEEVADDFYAQVV